MTNHWHMGGAETLLGQVGGTVLILTCLLAIGALIWFLWPEIRGIR